MEQLDGKVIHLSAIVTSIISIKPCLLVSNLTTTTTPLQLPMLTSLLKVTRAVTFPTLITKSWMTLVDFSHTPPLFTQEAPLCRSVRAGMSTVYLVIRRRNNIKPMAKSSQTFTPGNTRVYPLLRTFTKVRSLPQP